MAVRNKCIKIYILYKNVAGFSCILNLCLVQVITNYTGNVYGDVTFTLSNRKEVDKIPKIPSESISVYLKYNSISFIPNNSFHHLHFCTILDLEGNQIKSIEKGAFSGLPQLQILFLKTTSRLALNREHFIMNN